MTEASHYERNYVGDDDTVVPKLPHMHVTIGHVVGDDDSVIPKLQHLCIPQAVVILKELQCNREGPYRYFTYVKEGKVWITV